MSATASPTGPSALLAFWLQSRVRRRWFRSTPELDAEIRERFAGLWMIAAGAGLGDWEDSPEGSAALVILLDQFPLNMFRGRPEAFATEQLSREVADRAIQRGDDARLSDELRTFLYMPFMHSEDPADQDRSVALFERAGLGDNARWARHHRDIVRRFGRFPHRNAVLGRMSTPEEETWLTEPGSFKG